MNNTEGKKYSNDEVIDLRVQFAKLWKRKKLFICVWITTFILACVYILPQPRTYTVDLALAPEMGGASATGTLSSIASSFGFNLGNSEISDAFYPELYPDLLSTNKFIVDLLYTRVQTADGAVDTTYLNYILRHHRKNPYMRPYTWCRAQINKLFEEDTPPISHTRRMNPHRLTRREDAIVNKVRKSIQCDVDIKTNVIYAVPSTQSKLKNAREEYVYINGDWECIGTTMVDLNNYYTKEEIENLINSSLGEIETILATLTTPDTAAI